MATKPTKPLISSIGWTASRSAAAMHDARAEVETSVVAQSEAQLAELAAGELIGRLPEDTTEEGIEAFEAGLKQASADLGRGVFSALYGEPEKTQSGPAWARTAAGAVEQTQGWSDLRSATAGDPDMAAIATGALFREVSQQLPKLLEQLEEKGVDPSSEPSEGEDGEGGEGPAWTLSEAQALAEQEVSQVTSGRLKKAVMSAAKEVAEARGLLNSILPGLGTCPRQGEASDPRRLQLVERLRADARLMMILKVAGRIRRISQRVRKVQTDQSKQSVAGLERGGDVARIVPSELLGLAAGGELEDLFLKGLADRSLLQSKLSGREPLGRGPIVVMLDSSGSMSSPMGGMSAIDWAAAIGIAAVRAAVEQRRHVSVCSFDADVLTAVSCDGRDLRAAEAAVFQIAGITPKGGTNFTAPIEWALSTGAEKDRADLVLVTDGYGALSAFVVERLNESRNRGMRLWGVLIGQGANIGVLEPISDGIARLTGREEDPAQLIGGLGAL